jgi:hypothetical protein
VVLHLTVCWAVLCQHMQHMQRCKRHNYRNKTETLSHILLLLALPGKKQLHKGCKKTNTNKEINTKFNLQISEYDSKQCSGCRAQQCCAHL